MAAKGIYINPTTFVPLNKVSEGLTTELATRQFAAGAYTGFFNYLPDPDPVLRRLGMDQSVYEDLLSDDQVGPLLNRRKNLTKSLDWDVEPNDAGDAEVELCKKTLRILEENGCATKDIISQTLNPVFYGYSTFEIIWGMVDGKYLPVEIWEKPREWFVFDSLNRLRFRTIDNYEGMIIRGKDADPKIAAKFILLRNDHLSKILMAIKHYQDASGLLHLSAAECVSLLPSLKNTGCLLYSGSCQEELNKKTITIYCRSYRIWYRMQLRRVLMIRQLILSR